MSYGLAILFNPIDRYLVKINSKITEASTGVVLWKKVFLKTSQNSQEAPVQS